MAASATPPKRILIVGWDGGTWDVFRPLVASGMMPNLKRLMDRGAWGVLESTIPYLTPPAWTTLLTGLRPERHGIIGFLENRFVGDAPLSEEEGRHPVSARSIRHKTLLEHLGDAGRRVMSINVPMSYPPRPVNGILVSGMLTPLGAEVFTWPEALRAELVDYQIDLSGGTEFLPKVLRTAQYDDPAYTRKCTEIVAARARNICRLGRDHPWDFGIAIFTGTDRVFHRLWDEVADLLKRDAPRTSMDHLLTSFFAALDAALGDLVSAFPDALVMLVSDHGFGPRLEHAVYPNVCLEANGYLARRGRRGKPSLRRRIVRGARRLLRKTMETVLTRAMTRKLLARVPSREVRVMRSLDRERTLAYFVNVDNGDHGAVRLLPDTTASMTDAERTKLIDEIITALSGMTDPATGETVVETVDRAEAFFPGASIDCLPEIVIRFRPGYTGRVDPLETDLVKGRPASTAGWHRAEGMFLLSGAPVKPSGETTPMHLADVAPTVLYLSGLPVPGAMQGYPPMHLIDNGYTAAHALERGDDTRESGAAGTKTAVYTPEQEEQIKENLRRLGYMD